MRMVTLTAPNGTPVEVNADNVFSVRPAESGLDHPKAKAVITSIQAGGRQAVQETVAEALAKLG